MNSPIFIFASPTSHTQSGACLLIADEAVSPDIGYGNFHEVISEAKCMLHVHAPGICPKHPCVDSIHADVCDVIALPYIETDLMFRQNRQVHHSAINCRARIIANAGIGVRCPVHEGGEDGGFRRSPSRIESYVPWSVERGQRAITA